jgi:hypothetical protein
VIRTLAISMFRGKSGSLIKILWHDGIGMTAYERAVTGFAGCGKTSSLLPAD